MNARLLNSQPWRFEPGDSVYVRGWPADATARILCGVQPTSSGFPHYLVMDSGGMEWRIAQLHLSSKAIITR